MRVKVIKSSQSSFWYSKHIGEEFEVVAQSSFGSDWRVHGPYHSEYWIVENDAEIVEEKVGTPTTNKYIREIVPHVFVDVYDVLRAFNVTDPCIQHLAKKALCAGLRGHKDRLTDLEDILKSAERAIEMHKEWNKESDSKTS